MYIYLLWFWEDCNGHFGDWNLIGCFPTPEDAKQIADRENYPMIPTGFIWGGAKEWSKSGELGEDFEADDKGISAWYIQKVLMGSLIRYPVAYANDNVF